MKEEDNNFYGCNKCGRKFVDINIREVTAYGQGRKDEIDTTINILLTQIPEAIENNNLSEKVLEIIKNLEKRKEKI